MIIAHDECGEEPASSHTHTHTHTHTQFSPIAEEDGEHLDGEEKQPTKSHPRNTVSPR